MLSVCVGCVQLIKIYSIYSEVIMSMYKKCICLIALVFLLGVTSSASAVAWNKGPYLIYPGDNTQMTVLWQLDVTNACTLDWGLTTSYGMGSVGTTEYNTGTDGHQHKSTITGLTPGTKYFYRVTAGTLQGLGSFRSAPAATATKVKFFMYGDTRNNPGTQDTVNARMIAKYTADPNYQSITLFSGDGPDYGTTETGWTRDWFNQTMPNMVAFKANVPFAFAQGNHEIQVGTPNGGDLYGKYYPYVLVGSHYFSFDYGPAHILILDQYGPGYNGSMSAAQVAWVAADLAATSKDWKFLVFHAPGWTGSSRTNSQIRTDIQPLCVTYNVAICFASHEHF